MNRINLLATLYLTVIAVIAIGGLVQGLHAEAYEVPECSDVCICNPICNGATISRPCTDDHVCSVGAGSPNDCDAYCVVQ
jgi:hypothetical protein